jgi:hypothetical protein
MQHKSEIGNISFLQSNLTNSGSGDKAMLTSTVLDAPDLPSISTPGDGSAG